MCGIVGYTGHRAGVPIVMEGLRHLEYNGYDSSGVAFLQNDKLVVARVPGKLSLLKKELSKVQQTLATTCIGHTCWSTHNSTKKGELPATPVTDNIAIAYNGIIENSDTATTLLKSNGATCHSGSDAELFTRTLQHLARTSETFLHAFAQTLRTIKGAYSVAVINKQEPNVIYAARCSAPLLLGVGTSENFIASDLTAFLTYTKDVVFLEDCEIVRITPTTWEFFATDSLQPKEKEVITVSWDIQSAQRGGYKHFMLKEIFEQPRVISDCIVGRIDDETSSVSMPEFDSLPVPKRLRIVACGTSYHAGLWAMTLMEKWAGIPCSVEIASEFRYRDPLLTKDDCVLVISQSGETADTLAALRVAKNKHCTTLGICNVVGSSIAREADAVIYTQAGPEISVASTKALTCQMVTLFLMACSWGQRNKTMPPSELFTALKRLSALPAQLEKILPTLQQPAKELAAKYANSKGMFFLGRGQVYPLALEGALKMKELSYIHAEGYTAGEIKHGPIALIDPKFLSIVIAPVNEMFDKTKSIMEEINARGGPVVVLTSHKKTDLQASDVWQIPEAWGPLSGLFILPALQLLSYEMALYLGKDVDQPRNLTKSVSRD